MGVETRYTATNEGRRFPHFWKITKVETCQKITYQWTYEGYPGNSFVTFELHDTPQGCTLTLTHRVTADFPEEVPEFSRENCIGGWEWVIQKSLKQYFERKP